MAPTPPKNPEKKRGSSFMKHPFSSLPLLLAVSGLLFPSLTLEAIAQGTNTGTGTSTGTGTNDASLLLHPEKAFVTPSPEAANFAISIDKQPLSYADPTILFRTNSDTSDFIAGVWKDPEGHVIHQREVLIVKPDYGVVVDYLYGSQEHEITCVTSLTAGSVKTENGATLFVQGDGKGLIVRHNSPDVPIASICTDPTTSSPVPSALARLSEIYRLTLPSPFASVFCSSGASVPRFEYVKPANPMIVKCRVTMPDGRIDDVGIAWEARDLHLGGKHFTGWAAVARQSPGGLGNLGTTGDIEIKETK
jgi:hypothetical protein